MDFFSKKFTKNLDTVSFLFEFERKINKEEQEFIILLLNEFEKNRIDNSCKMNIGYCLNYFKQKNIRNLLQLIEVFLYKSINYHFTNKQTNILLVKGSFNLISSISYD